MMYSLYHDYKKFENLSKKYSNGSKIFNISSENFLAATTIVPLLCFAETNNVEQILTHSNTSEFVDRILNKRETSTTKPFVNLPTTKKEFLEQEIPTKIAEKIDENYGGGYTIKCIGEEIIGNIYNHTPLEEGYANQGYSFAQEYVNVPYLDICVMDDGLSIPGNFEKHGIDFADDCDAISKAIEGITTAKNEYNDPRYSRGHGLWTVLRLVIEGNGGEALIVSRQGCLHIPNNNSHNYYKLKNKNIFKGTLISLRLTRKLVENYYDLLEISHNRTKYKYKPIKTPINGGLNDDWKNYYD